MKRKRKVHDWAIEELAKRHREWFYIRICPNFKCVEFRLKDKYREETVLKFTRIDFHEDGTISRIDKIEGRRNDRREGNDSFVLLLRDYIDSGLWLKTRWKNRTQKCRIRYKIKVDKIEDIIVPKNWISHKIYCSTRSTPKENWKNNELTDLRKRSKYRSRLMSDLNWVYGLDKQEISDIAQVDYETVRRACQKYKMESLNTICFLKKNQLDDNPSIEE